MRFTLADVRQRDEQEHDVRSHHHELHKIHNIGWLRAAVLGANDGIVSTSCLILGVASANAEHSSILLTGVAGIVAGAMSMATGEYISVSSQADTEKAALTQEKSELVQDYPAEILELTAIYVRRGLDPSLAKQVAEKMMAHDALGAHARDELGINELSRPRPLQAAFASAGSFAAGAMLPLIVTAIVPASDIIFAVSLSALIALAILGALAAQAGAAPLLPSVMRITFWSALAMAVTAGVGKIFGNFL